MLVMAGAGGKANISAGMRQRTNGSQRRSPAAPPARADAEASSYKPPQRERLVSAMIELCAQSGYQQVSIAPLCATAGVSSTTFYELFDDKEACFLAAYRASVGRLFAGLNASIENSEWPEATRHALGELFDAVRGDPVAGRLLFIEALAGGPAITGERARMLAQLERSCEDVVQRTAAGGDTLDVPVLAVTGALRHIVSRHLRTNSEDQLPGMVDDLLAWLASYAVSAGSRPWSQSPHALLDVLGEPLLPAPLPSPARLPPGRHGLPAGVVARSQRTRLINATAEVMLAKGYADATVADIVSHARVARPVFYEHFADKQEAFLEAQQYPTQFILDRCAQAYFSARDWPQRMWRMLEALLGLIVANPAISHLRLVECYSAGPAAIRQAEEVTRSFTIFIEEGYHYREEAAALPRLCSQAIAGAIFEIVQQQMARRDYAAVPAQLPRLCYVAIAPFTGAREASGLVEEMKHAPREVELPAAGPRQPVRVASGTDTT